MPSQVEGMLHFVSWADFVQTRGLDLELPPTTVTPHEEEDDEEDEEDDKMARAQCTQDGHNDNVYDEHLAAITIATTLQGNPLQNHQIVRPPSSSSPSPSFGPVALLAHAHASPAAAVLSSQLSLSLSIKDKGDVVGQEMVAASSRDRESSPHPRQQQRVPLRDIYDIDIDHAAGLSPRRRRRTPRTPHHRPPLNLRTMDT